MVIGWRIYSIPMLHTHREIARLAVRLDIASPREHGASKKVAEREGFEPSIRFLLFTLSRGAP
jgi:hypothetical protein